MYNPVAIKVAMVEENLSALDLSKRAGLNVNTVRSVLSGNDVKVSTLVKIARVLRRDVRTFFLTRPSSELLANA